MSNKFKLLIISSLFLIVGCGSGAGTNPASNNQAGNGDSESTTTTATNPNGGPLAVEFDDLQPVLGTATYADALIGCAALDIEEYREQYSCSLSELPFIGQQHANPSIDDIMGRVVVSHDWMGERFRDALEVLPADVLLMFRAVTAIVIDADIRPAYYWGGTAAIYLDPFYLWTTNAEKQTINRQEDFRASFGDELNFIDTWRYTKDNDFAFPSWSLNNDVERNVDQMSMALLRLLYHELAHANDFMPPAELAGLSPSLSVLQALESVANNWVSNELYDDSPANSQLMVNLADARFRTGEPSETQKTFSAEFVGSEHANDVPNHFYGYSTRREDLAMMFEAVMMKRNFDIEMDIAYLDIPTQSDPSCNDYKVGWGKRNLIGSALVKDRANFVAAKVLPELDWNLFFQNIDSDKDMLAGVGWCANLVLSAAPTARARATAEKASAGDDWRDLNPRIH